MYIQDHFLFFKTISALLLKQSRVMFGVRPRSMWIWRYVMFVVKKEWTYLGLNTMKNYTILFLNILWRTITWFLNTLLLESIQRYTFEVYTKCSRLNSFCAETARPAFFCHSIPTDNSRSTIFLKLCLAVIVTQWFIQHLTKLLRKHATSYDASG